jgi:hypothetical protein
VYWSLSRIFQRNLYQPCKSILLAIIYYITRGGGVARGVSYRTNHLTTGSFTTTCVVSQILTVRCQIVRGCQIVRCRREVAKREIWGLSDEND